MRESATRCGAALQVKGIGSGAHSFMALSLLRLIVEAFTRRRPALKKRKRARSRKSRAGEQLELEINQLSEGRPYEHHYMLPYYPFYETFK